MDPAALELLKINQQLLEAIAQGDWNTYAKLCDPSITAFEGEARGELVEGMPFHRFYFDLDGQGGPTNTTMCAPHVRIIGDVGIVCCVRLVQHLDADRNPGTRRSEETRIWQRQNGQWRHIHFHRSSTY